MKRSGSSSLGAFFLAVGRLRPDPETAAQIAALLNLSDEDLAAGAASRDAGSEAPPEEPPPGDAPAPLSVTGAVRLPLTGDLEVVPSGEVRAFQVHKVSGPTAVSQHPLPTLPSSAPPGARELPFEPLLRPVSTRAVVVGSIRRRRQALGPVDVERLADALARKTPLLRVPRLATWTTTGQTWVLADRGPGMAPFTRDVTDFADRIRTVAGRERTEVMRFWQTPRRAGTSQRAGTPLPTPPPGTALLALTDLGIARAGAVAPDLERDWLDFAAEVRAADCSLMVFVPYPAERWPPLLADKLTVVPWDRRTSLADVLAAQRYRGVGA